MGYFAFPYKVLFVPLWRNAKYPMVERISFRYSGIKLLQGEGLVWLVLWDKFHYDYPAGILIYPETVVGAFAYQPDNVSAAAKHPLLFFA